MDHMYVDFSCCNVATVAACCSVLPLTLSPTCHLLLNPSYWLSAYCWIFCLLLLCLCLWILGTGCTCICSFLLWLYFWDSFMNVYLSDSLVDHLMSDLLLEGFLVSWYFSFACALLVIVFSCGQRWRMVFTGKCHFFLNFFFLVLFFRLVGIFILCVHSIFLYFRDIEFL